MGGLIPSVNQCRFHSLRNLSAAASQMAMARTRTLPALFQHHPHPHTRSPRPHPVEFHMYWHEEELRAWCQSMNISIQSYSPTGAEDHMAFHPVSRVRHTMPMAAVSEKRPSFVDVSPFKLRTNGRC
jgi:hypothetical protein